MAGALDADPAWQRWWQTSGIPRLTAHLSFDDPQHHTRLDQLDNGAEIRPGRRQVEADFWTSEQPFTSTDRVGLRHRAIADLTSMLDRVRHALDLPRLPRLPSLPDLPADLPDSYPSVFDSVDAALDAIAVLSRDHDRVTPQMINQYISQHTTGESGPPT